MGGVRRYFCCTTNLTACKIVGGIQLAFTGIGFILAIIIALSFVSDYNSLGLVLITITALFGLMLLFPIFLIAGAANRNSCLLMTCIILNALSFPIYAVAVFASIYKLQYLFLFMTLVDLGIGIWVELVAIGGYQEVKNPA